MRMKIGWAVVFGILVTPWTAGAGGESWETLNEEADRVYEEGDYRQAVRLFEQAVAAARDALGEDDIMVADLSNSLALAYRAQGELRRALELQMKVVERFLEVHGPEHPQTLITMSVLASIKKSAGDLSGARALEEQVLATRRRILDAEDPSLVTAMGNLATSLRLQGELSRARALEEEVLALRRRIHGPDHLNTWIAMSNLAITLEAQGDLAGARELKEKDLEARRRALGPEHPYTLTTMNNLALNLQAQGDVSGARELLEEVLAGRRRSLGREHPLTLNTIQGLALVLAELGEVTAARKLQEEALSTIRGLLGSEHRETLVAMHNLAWTLHFLGEVEGAKRLATEIIEIRERLGGADRLPDTFEEALAFYRLAQVCGDAGDLAEAGELFSKALDALERQTLKVDFSEDVRSLFRSKHSEFYRYAVANALARERAGEALYLSERFRAQGLLALVVSEKAGGTIPPELEAARREVEARYDAVYLELDRVRGSDPERAAALAEEQSELRRRRGRIQNEIRRRVLGERPPPRPLGLEAIREALDPGTLLFSYIVDEKSTALFVLSTRGELEVHDLPIGEKALSEQIESFNRQLAEKTSSRAQRRLAGWLFDKLVAPAAESVARADRLLILPDGPLHFLPFGALVRKDTDGEADGEYLVEWKPLHVAASATVYAELRERRASAQELPWQLVAFGDPVYPGESEADAAAGDLPPAVRSAIARGLIDRLGRLGNASREILRISRLFPDDAVRVHLREDAREERAKAEAGKARILHFATHGLYDPDHPFDSFLALSRADGGASEASPAPDNGVLQAWEISQSLSLGADLVVLSACDTALGPNRDGEGLLSLSRAFLIAGARSVVASLWKVEDLSTSELMIRFYGQLRAGKPKAEALRAAQLELIGGPIEVAEEGGAKVEYDFTAPFYWAAFQLIGDWR